MRWSVLKISPVLGSFDMKSANLATWPEVIKTGSGVMIVASTSSIVASWSDDAPGATCSASVTLRDAQGRTTASTRDARVVLDLLGFPRPPGSVRQTAYADGSVRFLKDTVARPIYRALSTRSTGEIIPADAE